MIGGYAAITKRKIAMDAQHIMAAVHQMDLQTLTADKVGEVEREGESMNRWTF